MRRAVVPPAVSARVAPPPVAEPAPKPDVADVHRVARRAFMDVTKPLRAKVSFGDDVAMFRDGKLWLGRIDGLAPGDAVRVRGYDGAVVEAPRADLRMPPGGRRVRD